MRIVGDQYCGGVINIDQNIIAFRKYCDGDASWLTEFEWKRIVLH